MNSYQREQLENIRRVCVAYLDNVEPYEEQRMVDTFLHLINLVELIQGNG